jgi:pyridoxal phosphate enzyme (YggS family)
MTSIADNLIQVQERIREACRACGREDDAVELVAVSKRKPAAAVQEAFDAGQELMGENRVQEVMEKQPHLPGNIRWHLIGHLQSNKVKHALHCRFELIHSVDSAKLLQRVNDLAAEEGWVQPVLLQVNISGEGAKFGLPPEELIPLLEEANTFHHVEIQGLMTMPPLTRDPADAAPHFAALRALRDKAAAETGFTLPHLSMGMSRDLEWAIQEGATLVRVGTDIFGARA